MPLQQVLFYNLNIFYLRENEPKQHGKGGESYYTIHIFPSIFYTKSIIFIIYIYTHTH
jgi:hypothetical protein